MSYIRVHNFERYQNADIFKKSGGRPPWVKLYRDLLLDDDLLELSYPAQLLFDRLLLVASGCRNVMSSDAEWLAKRTGMDADTIREEIPKLVRGGWLTQTRSRRRSRNIRETFAKDSPPRTEQNRNKTYLVEGKNGAHNRAITQALLEAAAKYVRTEATYMDDAKIKTRLKADYGIADRETVDELLALAKQVRETEDIAF